MRFLKALWKFLVGVKDLLALILLLIIFAGLSFGLSSGGHAAIASGGALYLDLNGSLSEQPADARPLDLVEGAGGPQIAQYRLRDMIRALDAAAADSRVKAVVLQLDGFTGGGQTAIAAVGRSLDKVRAAGKPVLAHATGYDDASYLLAAHASEIWLDPLGAVLTPGPGGSQLYYKGLLDKLGVNAHVYRVGKFKSAVEPYTRTEASPEAKQAEQALVAAIWAQWQAQVKAARPKVQFADYLAQYGGGHLPNTTLAENAVALGLVDKLGDRIAFGQRVAQIVGAPDGGKGGPGSFKAIDYDAWVDANPAPTSGDAIGVLTIAGDIVDGKGPAGTAAADSIADSLTTALGKGDMKALVVRVDSPGGSVTGSDRIRSAILAAHAKGLPVVISMGSVAASGGYWISTAGDEIIADPSTITGSIGVFGIIPTFEGSLRKIGLSADGIQATPLSGEPDTLRGTTPVVDALIQAGINQTYARFIGLVGAARHLPVTRVDEIGQGRVWDGVTAKKIGLVDKFGGLDDAVAEAARLAKLDPAKVHAAYIERESSTAVKFFKMLTGGASSGDSASAPRDPFSSLSRRPDLILAQAVGDARRIAAGPAIQVRCMACGPETPSPQDITAARALMAHAAGAVTLSIRPVRLEDAGAIAAIYAPYVSDTVITFELDPPDEAEFRARIQRVTATHPWLVAEKAGVVLGYAYGATYRTRAAYRWVCETGIYLSGAARGQGIGTPLYRALLDELAARGFVAALGVMTAGNPGSTALHEKLGFVDRGTQPGIGYKHGAWHDVVFWQKELGPRVGEPKEPCA